MPYAKGILSAAQCKHQFLKCVWNREEPKHTWMVLLSCIFASKRRPRHFMMELVASHVRPLEDDIPKLCLQSGPLQPGHCQLGGEARSVV